ATPAVYRDALKEGLIEIFMQAGYCVTNPTCGACLGMSNGVLAEGEVCASTTNRNFNGRMGKGGMVHLMSPASAVAAGITGRLTDPREYIK
ncbi:MAG: aconitase family protein, partial [Chitinivibrionales bacterium]|nr:aconitase family protein [Chitinivibrionales bacterium]